MEKIILLIFAIIAIVSFFIIIVKSYKYFKYGPKEYRDIRVGDIWYHSNYQDNPFKSPLPDTVVKITDIKINQYGELWIQYQDYDLKLDKPYNDKMKSCPVFQFIYRMF